MSSLNCCADEVILARRGESCRCGVVITIKIINQADTFILNWVFLYI
jgi:hypothetical protein